MSKVTDYDKEFVLANLHLTNKEIGYLLRRSENSITGILRKNNIIKYKEMDHSKYFNIPCYPEYAYILGWLFADGHVSVVGNRLSLSINRGDAECIESVMMDFYPWKKRLVKYKMEGSQEQIEFACYKMDVYNFFINEWQFHRKSYGMSDNFYEYLATSSEDCKKCFFRGFFDGDGYVFKDKPFFSIGKRIDFDWTNILKLIPQFTHYKIRTKDPGTGKCRTSSLEIYRDGPLFFQYIYGSQFKVALPRKKDRVLAHFAKPYYKEKYGELEQ